MIAIVARIANIAVHGSSYGKAKNFNGRRVTANTLQRDMRVRTFGCSGGLTLPSSIGDRRYNMRSAGWELVQLDGTRRRFFEWNFRFQFSRVARQRRGGRASEGGFFTAMSGCATSPRTGRKPVARRLCHGQPPPMQGGERAGISVLYWTLRV